MQQLDATGYITTLPSHVQNTAIRRLAEPSYNNDCHPKKLETQPDCHPNRDLSLNLTQSSGLTCERGGDREAQPQLDVSEPIGEPEGAQYCAAWAVEPSGPPTYRRRESSLADDRR